MGLIAGLYVVEKRKTLAPAGNRATLIQSRAQLSRNND
jgi:hypothetical protein